ncbi:MAG: hypothetical protein H0U49_12720 [Parachlamydiaceae bacterium]|nr:hypothetical protein [Parachlamydiaceae bacterium]
MQASSTVNSRLPINNTNAASSPPSKIENEATEYAAKVMGAVAGSLAAVATLFITLATTASSMSFVPALLVALASSAAIGIVAALVTYLYTKAVGSAPVASSQENKFQEILRKSNAELLNSQDALRRSTENLQKAQELEKGLKSNIISDQMKKELDRVKEARQQTVTIRKERLKTFEQLKNVIKSMDAKPNLDNLSVEDTLKELKTELDKIENLLQLYTKGMDTEQSQASLKVLINKSISLGADKTIIDELELCAEELRNDATAQNKEVNDVIELLIVAIFNYQTKAMTKEDRTMVFAPYANNPKYSHLLPKN